MHRPAPILTKRMLRQSNAQTCRQCRLNTGKISWPWPAGPAGRSDGCWITNLNHDAEIADELWMRLAFVLSSSMRCNHHLRWRGEMLSARLPPEIESRLPPSSKATGRTKSFRAREAILECLDDCEDLNLTEQSLVNIRAGNTRAILLGQVMRGFGIKGLLEPSGSSGHESAALQRPLRRRDIGSLCEDRRSTDRSQTMAAMTSCCWRRTMMNGNHRIDAVFRQNKASAKWLRSMDSGMQQRSFG